MKANQERVGQLLTETVTLLCKNGLHFSTKLRIEGVLGITLDDDQVFIVHINESLDGDNIENFNTNLEQSSTNVSRTPRRNIEELDYSSDSTSFDRTNAYCLTKFDQNSVKHRSPFHNKNLKSTCVLAIDHTQTLSNYGEMELTYEDCINYDVPNAINKSTFSHNISEKPDENFDEELNLINQSNIKTETTANVNASSLNDCAAEELIADTSGLQHFQYQKLITPNIEIQLPVCGRRKLKNNNSVSLVKKRVYNSGINDNRTSYKHRSRSGDWSLWPDIRSSYSIQSTVACEIRPNHSNSESRDTSLLQSTELVSSPPKTIRRRHSGFGQKAFTCQEDGCRRMFFRSSELYRHQRINHGASYRQPRLTYSQLDCYIEEK